MIDFEKHIFNACATALETAHSGIFVSNAITVGLPAQFPSCDITEASNVTYDKTIDSSNTEQMAKCVYTVTIHSNKRVGAKAEAKDILDTVDTVLYGLNMSRRSVSAAAIDGGNVHRIIARYECIVDKYGNVYRR